MNLAAINRKRVSSGPVIPVGLSPALITVAAQDVGSGGSYEYQYADISDYIGKTVKLAISYQNGTWSTYYRGDVQLDDFDVGGTIFSPETGTEGFERQSVVLPPSDYSSQSWEALANGATQKKWNRDGGSTGSSGTGFTGGNTGNYHFYAETSGSGSSGAWFWLRSPSVVVTTGDLSFYTSQYGVNCGPIVAYLDVIS